MQQRHTWLGLVVSLSLCVVSVWAQPWPTVPMPSPSMVRTLPPGFVPPPFPRQPVIQPEIPLIPGTSVPGLGTLQPLPMAPGCLTIQPSPRWVRVSASGSFQQQPGLPRLGLHTFLFANPISACPLPSNQVPVFNANGILHTPSYQVFDQLLPALNPAPQSSAQGYRAIQRSTRSSCWFGVDAATTIMCNHPVAPPPSRGQSSPSVLSLTP